MVQSYEYRILLQVNVDLFFHMWYDEYIGAAVGCPFFFTRASRKTQKKWPLTVCSFSELFSVKGHFCSFLLSNIIGYLAFLNLDFWAFSFWFLIISFSDFKNQFAWPHLLVKSWFFTAFFRIGFDFWSISGFVQILIPDV